MSQLLTNRAFLITGGSMGIGLACAEEIVREGGRVAVFARTEKPLRSAVEHLNQLTPRSAIGVSGDVLDIEAIKSALHQLGKESWTLYGAVHCAGVHGAIGPAVDAEPEAWFSTIRANLFGSFLVAKTVASHLKSQGQSGSIVLLSGGGATGPRPDYTAYGCAKTAIVRLAETMAVELADAGIRVNSLAPGFVATRLHHNILPGRWTNGQYEFEPQAIAGAVSPTVAAKAAAFLLSDRSQRITGRLLAAPHDDFASWPQKQLIDDYFTLRRIVPRDRGESWQ